MRFFCAIAILAFSQTGLAGKALLDFSSSMYSFSAEFTQTVYDADSVVLQESSGQVQLMRPGKFRWTYDEPIRQLIVADGVTLWVYDEDIAQVTMQPQATTLGSAPIGLLSGERAIESEFEIIDLGNKDELHWFQLEPLVKDTDFNQVFIALDDTGLRAMELRDNFEQATQIRFNNFKKNTSIAAEQFQFEPPESADVVGEAGVATSELATESTGELPTVNQAASPAPEQSQVSEAELINSDADLLATPVTPGDEDLRGTSATTSDEALLATPAEPASQQPQPQSELIEEPALTKPTEVPQVPDEPVSTPASAEDVLQSVPTDGLTEVTDDDPGIEDIEQLDDADREITLEVIRSTVVPAE